MAPTGRGFRFGRTTGALVFNAAPNFESPADVASSDPVNAGGNNEYLLVVTAKSGSGAREMSAQQSITVTVLDVNEPPVIPARSTFDVDENTTGCWDGGGQATWTTGTRSPATR